MVFSLRWEVFFFGISPVELKSSVELTDSELVSEVELSSSNILDRCLVFFFFPPPVAPVPGYFIDGDLQYRLPYKVFPVSAILRGVQVSPPAWPNQLFGMDSQSRNAQLSDAARCASGPVLVFWPPTRHTFLPQAVATVPLHPDGANEVDADENDDDVDGVEDMMDAE